MWASLYEKRFLGGVLNGRNVEFAEHLKDPSHIDELQLRKMAGVINASVSKRIFDIILSLVGLILAAPLFLFVSLGIILSSHGPVFFVQKRYGKDGKLFNIYKFRTMLHETHQTRDSLASLNEMSGPAFKIKNDPRIYPFGKWLRKFTLDELPQLWNILKGDMSFVGPRPFQLGDEKLFKAWHYYRHLIKPGATSFWQIMGRNEITDFDQWALLDLKYIQTWTIWKDFEVVAKTPLVILRGTGR